MEDITINQGDSCYLTVTKKDESGTQIDFVSGEEVILSAKKKLNQEEFDIQSALASLSDGKMIIYLSPTDTDVPTDDYYYDVQYTDLQSDVYTLVKGTLTIDWDVTNE